ncbi:cyclic-di-AMP-binding protein CbpB [Bacillus kexueae]|uniref:cyclic-di-AMP-binding protein CbpB n=1 Tax=Aeribacillus kexueae TaxID=2078952 RepID=UPI001FAEAA95|nr:cyclic-di-AMP-binding protein CbpB [Bacillus kexueae]
MFSVQSDKLVGTTIGELIIPADKVAHVQMGNNLQHALLVLTKTGYTAVPVLDAQYRLHGLISTNRIMDSVLGLERFEMERLEGMCVEEVMNTDIPRLFVGDELIKALKLVINHPFVCVTNEDGVLEGIFTRRVILKHLHKHVRSMNK